jgi:hypothetical protein
MNGPASHPPMAEPSEQPDEIGHPGRWLVETLRGLGEIELPSRDDNRGDPFADWAEEDLEPPDSAPPRLIPDPPEPCK